MRVHKDHPASCSCPAGCCGIVWSYQTIDENGKKRFPEGGRVDGLYFLIGGPIGILTDKNYIGEGFATMAKVYEARTAFSSRLTKAMF